MSEPRWSFTALELLDGGLFVIDQQPCSVISELGGGPWPVGPTDILDPATGHWTSASALNATRSGFLAVRLPDSRVLVTGGDNGWWGAYSSTKLFDPATGRWNASGLLNTARKSPIGAVLPDGRVLVAGGTYSVGFKDRKEFERVASGIGTPPEERGLISAELYDPQTGRWTPTGSMHGTTTASAAYVLPDGRVLVVGQLQTNGAQPVEAYDPATGSWSVAGSLMYLPGSAAVVLANGSLLTIGGMSPVANDEAVATVRRFDPRTGATSDAAPLPAPRSDAAAVRLADGRVLVAGGTGPRAANGRVSPTATALIYDPSRDTWTTTTPMPFAVMPGAAVRLADGSVIVTGGGTPARDIDVCGPDPVGWTARFTLTGAAGG